MGAWTSKISIDNQYANYCRRWGLYDIPVVPRIVYSKLHTRFNHVIGSSIQNLEAIWQSPNHFEFLNLQVNEYEPASQALQ